MSPLEMELDTCLARFEGCQAAGYIDLDSGFMLAIKSAQPMNEEQRELLAVAAYQVMNSATTRELGEIYAGPDAAEGSPAFAETVVMSSEAIHIFARMKSFPDEAVCLVFRPDANPDDVLDAARFSVERLANAGFR